VNAPWIAAFLALWLLVLALALLQLGLLRRIAPVLEAAERQLHGGAVALSGLPAGAPLPDFAVETRDGEVVRASSLRGQETIWLLASPGCAPCEALAAELRDAGEPALGVPLVAVADASGAGLRLPPGVVTLFQRDRAAAVALQADATPHAVAVDGDGVVVATTTPNTLDDLQALAALLTGGDPPPAAPSGAAART